MIEDKPDYSIKDNWGIWERKNIVAVCDDHISREVAEDLLGSSEEKYWKIVVVDMTQEDEEHFHVRHFFIKGFLPALKFCASMNIDYGFVDDEMVVELSPISDEEMVEIRKHFPEEVQ